MKVVDWRGKLSIESWKKIVGNGKVDWCIRWMGQSEGEKKVVFVPGCSSCFNIPMQFAILVAKGPRVWLCSPYSYPGESSHDGGTIAPEGPGRPLQINPDVLLGCAPCCSSTISWPNWPAPFRRPMMSRAPLSLPLSWVLGDGLWSHVWVRICVPSSSSGKGVTFNVSLFIMPCWPVTCCIFWFFFVGFPCPSASCGSVLKWLRPT